MMKQNDSIKKIGQVIDGLDDLLLISHILPDGDNIGSLVAMTLFLKERGKKATAVINGELPPYYGFLEGISHLVPRRELEKRSYDGVICLDMSDKERGGDCWRKIEGDPVVINIDHHISNEGFGDYCYVQADASSTAEIITAMFEAWHVDMTRAMAEALYTGILTDSGCFTYGCTSAQTLRMAALLLEKAPDLEKIRENVLENVSFLRKKLLARVLADASLDVDGRLCYAAIDLRSIKELGVSGPDFEGIIDHLIGITGVEYAIFFRETEPGKVKVGFRGRGDNDVTVVASKFGGGGHKAAAGCTYLGDLKAAVDDILKEARCYLKEK